MTDTAILSISSLLLLAFALERLSRMLRIPSVVVLIAAGLLARPVGDSLGFTLRGIEHFVPFLGTLGLILIVLEGALDIRLHRQGRRASMIAMGNGVIGFALCVVLFSALGYWGIGLSYYDSVLLAVPFSVISSAIAIPSASILPRPGREFVVYESSISDIVAILVFYSLVNSDGTLKGAMVGLLGSGMISLLLGIVCAVGLVLVLMRIDGHIRFIPLLAGLLFLYAVGKLLHLSPLILVLLFGLALNNPVMLTRFRVIGRWFDDSYEGTLDQFKMLVMELTFAVRGFFFFLLGYWTELSEIATWQSWLAAGLVLLGIYAIRYLLLRLLRVEFSRVLLWLAPRGLITVLLFLQARDHLAMPGYASGTVILVVLASSLLIILARASASHQPPPAPATDEAQ